MSISCTLLYITIQSESTARHHINYLRRKPLPCHFLDPFLAILHGMRECSVIDLRRGLVSRLGESGGGVLEHRDVIPEFNTVSACGFKARIGDEPCQDDVGDAVLAQE
jgi:hypothetical protein